MYSCLIVLLNEIPTLLCGDKCPVDSFFYNGIEYVDSGHGNFTGFYDWLRTDDEAIIGVCFNPLIDNIDEMEIWTNEFLKYSYVNKSEEINGLDIFFSDKRIYNLSKSDDQDYENSQIYKSPNGLYAVSFGLREVISSSLNSTYQLKLNSIPT